LGYQTIRFAQNEATIAIVITREVDLIVRTFSVVIHKEDDLYVAECTEVGTVSQGYTIDEAIANLKEATELYLEECPADYLPN